MKSSEQKKGRTANKRTDTLTKIDPPLNFSLFGLILLVLVIFISSAGIRVAYRELSYLEANEQGFIGNYLRADPNCWNEIVRYARNLNRFFIHHRGFDGEAYIGAVTEDDMAEDTAQFANTFSLKLTEALNAFNRAMLSPESTAAEQSDAARLLDEAISVLAAEYRSTFEDHRQVRLSERVANFVAIQNYLEATREFAYIIHDGVLERTFSNIPYEDYDFFLANQVHLIIDLSEITDTFNGIPLNEGFLRGQISGLIALPVAQPPDSVVELAVFRARLDWRNSIDSVRTQANILIGLGLAMAILTTIIIVKVVIPGFKEAKAGFWRALKVYLRIPFLLKLILAVYAIAGAASFLTGAWSGLGFAQLPLIYFGVIIIIFTFLLVVCAFRGRYRFSDEFEYRLVKKVFSSLFVIRRLSPVLLPMVSVGLMLISLCFLVLFLYIIFVLSLSVADFYYYILLGAGAFGLFLMSLAALILFSNYAESYYYLRIIAAGSPVSIPEQKGFFAGPLNMLNGLSEGLQASLEEQLHAERTKTELITNVSHDLKTPLTSIINYVDLLKNSKIEDETAREYVEILENKSERLKILIEDLFEAAKLTTGSMELSLAPVDIVQLLTQAIGEVSEKFDRNNIEVRFKVSGPPGDKLIVMLDGQRMWRVFENLLNNMANYSPEGSRAYINAEARGDMVEIIMKNVSLYPLDFDANELFERFKRGDAARTTEGSGLGLSIAKDIVELHGGKVDITIDGDLFKVTIGLKR